MKGKILVMATIVTALGMITGCGDKKCCSSCCGKDKVRLITIDPGHFHAALIQKQMYPGVSSIVHVYAPKGDDLDLHIKRVESFNTRKDNPTSWECKVYTGDDFMEKAISEKAGNVVVLAGNNARKTEYILKSVEAGYHVLADKPMAITPADYEMLKKAYQVAEANKVFIYDIMTGRKEITNIILRELSRCPDVFGTQETGTADDPAVSKESVHHFSKMVAGSPLQRPPWYYDTRQQGEAIVDVNTHMVDQAQWMLCPDEIITPSDVEVINARSWPTPITLEQFAKSTSAQEWPEYLKQDLDDKGVLQCLANGEFTFKLKGIYTKVSVKWAYEAPAGSGDTHYSLMRGSRSTLIIAQGAAENFKTTVYVEPKRNSDVKKEDIEAALTKAMVKINKSWPGVGFEPHETGFRINIPAEFDIGHEAHFGQVAESFLGFISDGAIPAWENAFALVKYHTLMEAYKKSH